MFSGLVKELQVIVSVQKGQGGGCILGLRYPRRSKAIAPGSSVSVDGVCLTVERWQKKRLYFYVSPETLSKTTLGYLKPGAEVNLETSLKWGDPIGGHLVQGHVEGTARVVEIKKRGLSRELWVSFPAPLSRWLIPQGAVALAGVSLTVARLRGRKAAFALIPETLRRTTLGKIRVGHDLNVETDFMVKAAMILRKRGR